MKILILHGPNMNLLGLRSTKDGSRITLDKVNRTLRQQARNTDIELKIFQTHDEGEAVTFFHRNRNKADGLLFSPCAWHNCGFVIADTLKLINLPYITISLDKNKTSVYSGIADVQNSNAIDGYLEGLKKLITYLNK
ncbi:MAG: type II 3-dehydroquinate dehydratase [Candidatus Marinimicrobia bacterium]|nr:type II 3-dehydroquinate dehydratase [Candidatus Neomarinimicrobiota bacterium]MBL7022942.1 type II 3-dehydroquinate dehydratase [Candidatus Neomarinimicrobiota bacterium]MBL7108760.1 type II 3-dehydroquinate dehydratase [Candidatus Neomarinimicrobiota bacterium]